jgi:hypothetical protein
MNLTDNIQDGILVSGYDCPDCGAEPGKRCTDGYKDYPTECHEARATEYLTEVGYYLKKPEPIQREPKPNETAEELIRKHLGPKSVAEILAEHAEGEGNA